MYGTRTARTADLRRARGARLAANTNAHRQPRFQRVVHVPGERHEEGQRHRRRVQLVFAQRAANPSVERPASSRPVLERSVFDELDPARPLNFRPEALRLRGEVASLRNDIDTLQSDNGTLRTDNNTLRTMHDRMASEMSAQRAEICAMSQQLTVVTQQLATVLQRLT